MTDRISYAALIRGNRAFRNLWLADVVSIIGDWFSVVALFAMLIELTGKGEAVALMMIAHFSPGILFGPMAGVFADRFDRKKIMIACDLLRALVVLGFLLVRTADDVWIVYALRFVQMSVSTAFDTSASATTGAVVPAEHIVTANALQGITASTILCLGSLLGGVVGALLARQAVFVIDSASFVLSALFISRALIPKPAPQERTSGWRNVLDGIAYIKSNPKVRRVILLKAGWGLAGGGTILMFSVFGERVVRIGTGASAAIGLLYAARGAGSLLGPIVVRYAAREDEAGLKRAIGVSFFLMVAAYGAFAWAPNLFWACAFTVLSHMGWSITWVYSTALINLAAPDQFRGRVFAAEGLLLSTAMIISVAATGVAADQFSPRLVMSGLAAVLIVPTLLWVLANREQPGVQERAP